MKNIELNHIEIIQLLMVANPQQMDLIVEQIHPADVLDAIHLYDGDPLEILKRLPETYVASIIDEAEDDEKYELLTLFSKQKQIDIVDEMSSDELVDLLGSIDEEEQNSIIVNMDAQDAAEVRALLSYEPETAGVSWQQNFSHARAYDSPRYTDLFTTRGARCRDVLLYLCT